MRQSHRHNDSPSSICLLSRSRRVIGGVLLSLSAGLALGCEPGHGKLTDTLPTTSEDMDSTGEATDSESIGDSETSNTTGDGTTSDGTTSDGTTDDTTTDTTTDDTTTGDTGSTTSGPDPDYLRDCQPMDFVCDDFGCEDPPVVLPLKCYKRCTPTEVGGEDDECDEPERPFCSQVGLALGGDYACNGCAYICTSAPLNHCEADIDSCGG